MKHISFFRGIFWLVVGLAAPMAACASPAPAFHDVPIVCIHRAAVRYGLRDPILFAVLRTEDGRVGTVSPDANGTDDLGPAQINTCHLPFLNRYGYTFRVLTNNPCANIAASAWIFARCLSATHNVLNAAACYNAGSRPWLAWQSGYVQRFARFLGDPVVVSKPHFFGMGLSFVGVNGSETN